LEEGGERVFIDYSARNVDFDQLNMYQKNHYRRYEFARSLVSAGDAVGDFACGTGYGSAMLAEKVGRVVGVDLNEKVIRSIRRRYVGIRNLEFRCADLLKLGFESTFDAIVSFETIEHLPEDQIPSLFAVFNRALKAGGCLILSTPYEQPDSEAAHRLGFHKTFRIREETITRWLQPARLRIQMTKYQNYKTHSVEDQLDLKEMIICVAEKI
jgi:SAM-dependent methyltransferase